MTYADDLKLLGLFLKTHGIDGHLILKLAYFKENEIGRGEPVFIEIDGIPVPFFVSHFRFLSNNSAVVQLDEILNAKIASEFVNCRVFIENKMANEVYSEDSNNNDKLKGFLVLDKKYGKSGVLQEILEYPDNLVMRIDLNGREILVPFNENIVINIDYASCVIEISAPEGLYDLYL